MARSFARMAGTFAILLLTPFILSAQAPADGDAIVNALKPILVEAIPAVLYEKTDNWGHQAMVPSGVAWRGVRPTITESPRNHGTWKKLVINSQDLARTLTLKISDIKTQDDKQTFKIRFGFQMGVRYEQQNWENGVRLWSGSLQARALVKLDMDCENVIRVELDKNGLPDFILRLRVAKANASYDDLVVEHINGVGGSGAKLIGKAVRDCLHQWKPSIERDLLAKANAAVVKAADTREVRFGFGSLLKSK